MQSGLPNLKPTLGEPSSLDRWMKKVSLYFRKEEKRQLLPVMVLDYVYGWDISAWQPIIDWEAVRETAPQLKYVYIKSTEGTSYVCSTYTRQWNGAGLIGQLRGAYHYHHTEISGRDQARWFLAKSQRGELPACIDVEDAAHLPATPTVAQAKAAAQSVYEFVTEVSQAWGQRVIVYTGGWFWNRLAAYARAVSDKCEGFFATYRNLDDLGPYLASGWNKWTLWQYTSRGRITGCPDYLDFSVFHGGLEVFNQWAYGTVPPPPPPQTGFPYPAHVNNFPWGMYIRQQPNPYSPIVTWIPHNFNLMILNELNGWGQVFNGWVKLYYTQRD